MLVSVLDLVLVSFYRPTRQKRRDAAVVTAAVREADKTSEKIAREEPIPASVPCTLRVRPKKLQLQNLPALCSCTRP